MAKASSQTSALSGSRPSLWNLARALVIVALGWWIYLPALHGGWIWDDLVYLPQNPLLNDPDRLWKIWFVPGSFIEYYPIQQTVQWTQWELWQDDAFGYHVTNVILHLLGALLVWRLLSKLGLRLAWLGGLLFAIHPTTVESVAWISELKNTLSLPPFLLAMCAYIDFDNRRRKSDYLVSLAWFLVAMLCKISMAPFPFVLLLYTWWKRGRIGSNDLKASVPFFVISLVLGLTTIFAGIWFRPTHHMPLDQVEIGGFFARLNLIGFLGQWYFAHSLLPVSLSFFYPKEALGSFPLLPFISWAVFAGAISLLWRRRESWGRHILLGLGFFFINLAPFAGFTLPSYMKYTWAMDHFLYLPIIGLIGLAVAGMEQIDRRISGAGHVIGIVIVALLVIVLATESRHYARTFGSSEALWAHTVDCDPLSPAARDNYGSALVAKWPTQPSH